MQVLAPRTFPRPAPAWPLKRLGRSVLWIFLARLALGVAWPAETADTPGNKLFLPPDSTVVLLPGLPGDVETETSYRQQLQGWLDWLAGLPAPPRQTHAFWDTPESLSLPEKLAAKISPARRETFLALGQSLAGRTNPLAVIVWGHGGTQGRMPVFHLRGPRLESADLKSFADQTGTTSSRWVLLFRGSGHFARAISGENRQIISSECNTAFTSDPIGLPLLLQIAQANPTRSFVVAGEEMGRAVAAWYDRRNLARTEEPTLWLPGLDPVRLASTGQALDPAGPTNPTATSPPAQEKPPPVKEAPGTLPAAWREIARVDPRLHADADAVILRRRSSFTLGTRPAITSEHDQFVQVLTAEGKEFGDFDLAYSPPGEELEVLDGEVLRPDGTLVRLPADQVRESAEPVLAGYQARWRKFFSLPGVVPGAVLRLRYRTQWQTYPLPHVLLMLPLAERAPVLDSTLEVIVPKDAAFHFAFQQAPASDPTLRQTSHGSRYSWRFQNLAALLAEPLAPRHQPPALLVSTFPDWASFAQWYSRIIRGVDELTPELAEKARELTRDAPDNRSKVRALYQYVAGLRYVAVPLGVSSVRPHTAAQVLNNQFGDCKDKANLLNTLLRALDLEAALVLVPRFSQAYEAVPGLAFNHAISRVNLDGEPLWLDTTDDVCRFGLLPPGEAGRNVLVIGEPAQALTALPRPLATDHRLHLRARLALTNSASRERAPISWQGQADGFPDYDLRHTARTTRDSAGTVPLLAARFRPAHGTFSLQEQSFTPALQLEEPFAWQATGHCLGLLSSRANQWHLNAPFWLPKEWDLALHRRVAGLFLHQGYPLRLDQEITVTLPASAARITLPAPQTDDRPPLRWKIEWTHPGDRTLVARLMVELDRGELGAGEVAELQGQLGKLLTFLAEGATFGAEF